MSTMHDGGVTTMVMMVMVRMMQEIVSTMVRMMSEMVSTMMTMMQGVVDSMCRCPPTRLPGELHLFLFHHRPSWEDNDNDLDDDDDEAQDKNDLDFMEIYYFVCGFLNSV